MKQFYDEVIKLAERLPTGAHDPNAMNRMYDELYEASQEIDGSIAQLIEYLDVLYYLCKAHYTGLIAWELFDVLVGVVVKLAHYNYPELFTLLIVKYEMRAQPGNPKNKRAEYKEVFDAIEAWKIQDAKIEKIENDLLDSVY